MRTHLSTVAAIFVALLFVSGTVGCRSNGGPWYNPTSYTWMKPSFAKDNQAPPFAPEAFANKKPSLDAQPNVDRPIGGYSDEPSFHASHSSSSLSSPSSNYPNEQSSYHNPVASNVYGGYTVAEPSPYPSYVGGQPSPMATSPQQYQYPAEMAQQGNPYGDYATGAQYPQTNVVYPSATPNQATPNYGTPSVDPYGGANPAMTSGNYAPFGAAPQNDPYAAMQQQQAPAAYAAPSPYANEGVPVASPYQPYQPTGTYSY